ncbi:hypothetical protein BJ170DRAFT_371738 [Xylariales sp. AK1849]|nr:hypothetical protein BJ170DRAFT_371738 [Xylariales sp. AK1849]
MNRISPDLSKQEKSVLQMERDRPSPTPHSGTPLRRILPAPSGVGLSPANTPVIATQALERRRQAVAVACHDCRKRKIKCSGERPHCRACIRSRLDCAYETLESKMSSRVLRRRLTALEARHKSLEDLVDILKTACDADVASVLGRIRAGADVESVTRHVQDGDLLLQLSLAPDTQYQFIFPYRHVPAKTDPDIPYLKSQSHFSITQRPSEGHPSPGSTVVGGLKMYRVPFNSVQLEPQLQHAKASQWTNIASDDTVVRELLQTFLTPDRAARDDVCQLATVPLPPKVNVLSQRTASGLFDNDASMPSDCQC